MRVSEQPIILGTHASRLIRLIHPDGAFIELLTYGARLHQVVLPSGYGSLDNVLYAPTNLEHYFTSFSHLGALHGPYFEQLPPIDAPYESLFASKEWQVKSLEHTSSRALVELRLNYYLEQAKVQQLVKLRISFSIDYKLSYQLEIVPQDRLIFNCYPMLYWNLSGTTASIAQHHLAVDSHWLLQQDDQGLLSGGQTSLRIVPHLNFQKSTQLCHVLALDERKACCVKGGGIQGAYLMPQGSQVKLQLVHQASGRTLQLSGSGEFAMVMTKNRPWPLSNSDAGALGAKHDALLLTLANIPLRSSFEATAATTLLQREHLYHYEWHYHFALLANT